MRAQRASLANIHDELEFSILDLVTGLILLST